MKQGRRTNGEGSIYNNRKGGYIAQFRIGKNEKGKPRFVKKSFRTKRECEEWLSEMRKKYSRLSLEEYLLLTLYELFQMWFDSKKRVLKPKSLDRIESTVNTHILPAIGEYRLCDITSDDIQTLVFDKMAEKNLSKSSIKKAYDDLKNFFNYCMDNDFIDRSPMRRVTINGYDLKCENKVKSFDHDEMEKIIASATELYSNGKPVYECGLIFPIMYYTGMRIGEALGLKYKYVNFDEGYIDIVETVVTAKDRKADGEKRRQIAQQGGKTKNSCRRIPLNNEAAKLLKMQKERRYYGEEFYVFNIGREEIKAMEAHNVSRSFTNILKKNNIEHRGVHALRHTFSTDLKDSGVDDFYIERLMGHANANVTMGYMDARFLKMKKAVEKLDT